MKLVAEGINDAWLSLMMALNSAKESAPRGKKIKEELGVSVEILNPKKRILDLPIRKVSLPFAFGELLWYLSGRNDVEMMEYYSKMMKSFSDDGETLNSAYGYRIFGKHPQLPFNQWEFVVNKLKEDPDSRQAVIHLHTPNNQPTKDEVCTLSLQFFIRDGKLDMITTMRSNDVVWGFTYDVFSFTTFQELMANELDVEVGKYVHNVGSMHIYEKDFDLLQTAYNLYNELTHMIQYTQEFDYAGLTIHDKCLEDLINDEREYRHHDGRDLSQGKSTNKAINIMRRVLEQYEVYKRCGREALTTMLNYDNIFDCMMRNYTSRTVLDDSRLFIVEGCDGAGKSTVIKNSAAEESDFDVIAFAKPKGDFNKLVYFHTALLSGNVILDRFFYSEVVYGRTFRRGTVLGNQDIKVLESLLNYRRAKIIHMQTDPKICFERLDENDREVFSENDIKQICEGFVLIFRVSDLNLNKISHIVTK